MPHSGIAGRSILVVDDEDVFLRAVVEGLSAELRGVELYTAHDGEQALRVLSQRVVDLVVTDVTMPKMDGLTLVAEMISAGMRIPVIMVTAFGTPRLEQDARRHGVISVLDKPIEFSQLVELCRMTLRSLDRGSLDGITLAGLLQLLEMERRSGTVRAFCGNRSGRIHLDQGRIVGSTQGELTGAPALARILSWEAPNLELGQLRAKDEVGRPISLQAALLDAARQEDERSRRESSDAPTREGLGFEESGSGLLVLPIDESSTIDDTSEEERTRTMANIEQTINSAMEIQGAVAAALVDYESGMCLGSKANGFPIEVAAAGNTEVIRSKFRVMSELGLEGGITDILITLDSQYHLLMPLRHGPLFLYVAIDRQTGNLAMARHKLSALEKGLVV